jgi:hypothetical protein
MKLPNTITKTKTETLDFKTSIAIQNMGLHTTPAAFSVP